MLNAEQKIAVENRNNNLLISASAGSGKTFVLITRIVKMILEENVNVSKLLVVTFTNASAEELKQRLISKLSEEIVNFEDDKKQRIINQIEEIPLCDISTIHSFCVKLVRQYFYELNLDPSFKLVVEGLNDLKLKAINNVLDNYFSSNDIEFENLYFALNEKRSKTKLISLVLSVCDKLDKLQDKNSILNCFETDFNKNNALTYLNNHIVTTANLIKEHIVDFIKDIPFCCEKFIDCYTKILIFLENLTKNNDFLTNYNLIMGFEPIRNNLKEGDNKEDYAYILYYLKTELLKKVDELFNGYKDIEDVKTNISNAGWLTKKLLEVALNYKEELFRLKQENNILDLTDIVNLTLELLKNEKIKEEIKNKYDYIFIDEYQDTDAIQEYILTSIAKNNNMFMVGDIKQSIYGFRLCDPAIFSNKYALFQFLGDTKGNNNNNNIKVNLNSNYRSNGDILDFTNKVCSKCITKTLGKIDYKTDAMLKTETKINAIKNIKSVQIFPILREKTKKEELNILEAEPYSVAKDEVNIDEENLMIETEAKIIASQIFSIVGSELEVEEKNQIVKKIIKYSDICILSRTRVGYFEKLASKLSSYNIPVNIKFKNNLFSTLEVKMLIDLFKVISNFNDDISLSAVMYNFFDFTYSELNLIRNKNKECYFYDAVLGFKKEYSESIFLKIQNMQNILFNYKLKSNYISLYELAQEIVEQRDYISLLTSMDSSDEKIYNLKLFLNSLKNNNQTLNDFISELSNVLNTSQKDFNLYSGDNSVTLQTIHNSKGLEYPVVILGNCGKDLTRKPSSIGDISFNKEIGMSCPAVNIKERTKQKSVIENIIKFANKREEFEEYIRLLYVALTRAKNNLIIVGGVNPDRIKPIKNELDVLHSKTFMEFILNSFENVELKKIEQNGIVDFASNITIQVCVQEKMQGVKHKNLDYVFNKDNSLDFSVVYKVFNFEYPHKESTKISVKNTVSQLNATDDIKVSYNYAPKKLVVTENNILPPDKIGTLYHIVMQNIDFNIETIEEVNEQLNQFVSKGIITTLELKNIDINKIFNCLKQLKQLLNSSSKLRKEQPFIMLDSYNNFVKTSTAEDEVLVQGIIDLIIENADTTYVIDYKTTMGNEQHLIDLYSTQLKLYALSVSYALSKNNIKVLIYSFNLEKFIEIKP